MEAQSLITNLLKIKTTSELIELIKNKDTIYPISKAVEKIFNSVIQNKPLINNDNYFKKDSEISLSNYFIQHALKLFDNLDFIRVSAIISNYEKDNELKNILKLFVYYKVMKIITIKGEEVDESIYSYFFRIPIPYIDILIELFNIKELILSHNSTCTHFLNYMSKQYLNHTNGKLTDQVLKLLSKIPTCKETFFKIACAIANKGEEVILSISSLDLNFSIGIFNILIKFSACFDFWLLSK